MLAQCVGVKRERSRYHHDGLRPARLVVAAEQVCMAAHCRRRVGLDRGALVVELPCVEETRGSRCEGTSVVDYVGLLGGVQQRRAQVVEGQEDGGVL